MTVRVTHKKRNGERRYEDFRINAWHRVAQWGSNNLKEGQSVAVQGYLTQNASNNHDIEISAEEFILMGFTKTDRTPDAGNGSESNPVIKTVEENKATS